MGASIKSMTLAQAKAYRQQLKDSGKTASTSKEHGKVENYIKTLQPAKYGKEAVASAYGALASGVTTTGGWTERNLNQIESATGTRPQLTAPTGKELTAPTSKGDLPSYLSTFQDTLKSKATNPETRQSIVDQLTPSAEKPTPLNRVEEYDAMREKYGVAKLETDLTNLKSELEGIHAQKRERISSAEGSPVAMGVIAGRVGEVERQETFRIDAINRQISTQVDQLNSSYNVISTYMNYKGLDYQDSVAAYNTEFNQKLQIYQLVDKEMDEQRATARANLTLYANALTSGNMLYGNLSKDQKVAVNKMEIQSGLPVGFLGNLKMSAKDQLFHTSTDGTQATFMTADGKFKTVSTGVVAKTGSSASGFSSALTQGRSDLESGRNWGEVYGRISSAYPNAKPAEIDAGLGTQWREGGAYEAFKSKTSSKTDTSYTGALSDALSAMSKTSDPNTRDLIKRAFLADYPQYAKQLDDATSSGNY